MKKTKGRRFNKFVVYHKSTAGTPELHKGGPWFYQPLDFDGGEVWSVGHRSYRAALKAASAEVSRGEII